MKKIFQFAAVAILAIGLASCVKDAGENSGNNPAGTGNKFTFVLPSQSGAITYADPIATTNENKLDLTKTSIFMFDANNKLEAIIDGSGITPGTNGGNKTATIELDEDWSGSKTFFVIGNITQGASKLSTVVVGTTTIAQFQALITDVQTGKISSENGMLLSGTTVVTNIEQTPSSEVNLYRAVARFDISQDVAESNVTITRIDVAKANLNGYIMAYGRGVKASSLTTGDIDDISVNDAVNDVQDQKGVFYMYPTLLKADGSATEIFIVGKVGGQDQIFTLNVDCEIEANKRYIISTSKSDDGNPSFTLIVADWEGEETLVGQPGGGSGSNFGVASVGTITNGTFNAAYNSIAVGNPTAAFSATFSVKGTSTQGVTWEILPQSGVGLSEVAADIFSVEVVYDGAGVVYATPYFGYDLTIAFDAQSINADENFTTIVRLTDVASGATSDVIVYYSGAIVDDGHGNEVVMYNTGAGLIPAVRIGDIYWAPVNVGATTTDPTLVGVTSTNYTGHAFQWGRNIPFKFDRYQPTAAGPFTVEDANATNLLISDSTPYAGTGADPRIFDWRTPQATEGELWNGADVQGPCPDGWRIPLHSEATVLKPMYNPSTSWVAEENKVVFSDNYVTLHFVLAGTVIPAVEGTNFTSQGVRGHFWLQDLGTTTTHHARFFGVNADTKVCTTFEGRRMDARVVRCVKDAE